MFANEPSRSGWSQLVDSVHMHPPLAHESSASPTSQSSPPALLLHNPAADHQQLPHMAAHQPLQQAGPPGAPQNSTAQLKAAQHGLEFQYDSYSDSMGDEAMPEAASSAPGNSDLAAEHRPAPAPPAAVDIRLAAHQEAVEGSGQAAPAEPQDQREAGQQHDQQGLNDEEQQQHSQPQPGVLPQADGAGDSDSVDSQDPPAQQYGTNSRHMCSTGALPDQQPAKPALQARQGPSQQQERLVMPDSVAVQRPRRRRGRLVVQHAVRLAAAARNAMDSVAAPQHAGSMPALQGDTCGYASEPQLPSWLVPQAAADRQFQSEPQLPDAHNTLGDVPEMNASMPTGSAAWRGQRQRAHRVHAPSKDSQYGGLGRHAIASRHHASQSTVAAAAAGCAPHVTSQILSDSRATSDRQWQQQQRHQHSHLPRLQQSQRVASQVVVSDSRATSDLRWAQHGQARQAAPQQQPSPSQDAAGWGGFAPTPGHELAWEQPASDQAMSMFQASGAASGAASMAASGADAGADDLEIVISDSQPSPLQRPGRWVCPRPTPCSSRQRQPWLKP